MFAPIRPARWVAALALVVVASTTARAEDIYVENGVYVKQLPPWRQRMLQKKMLRRSGEVIVEAPPAVVGSVVRVPGPPASRRSMRPLFGPPRVPARIISPSESVIVPGAKVITPKARGVEPPAAILSEPSDVEEELDELPPVDLPPAKEKVITPAPGTITSPAPGAVISTPEARPTSPPIGLDPEPEPPLEAPAATPAPATGSAPRPKRSA